MATQLGRREMRTLCLVPSPAPDSRYLYLLLPLWPLTHLSHGGCWGRPDRMDAKCKTPHTQDPNPSWHSLHGAGHPNLELRCTRSITDLYFLFVCLLLAVLGLCSCVQAFSSCGVGGYSLVAVCRLLIAVASLVVEHQLWSVWAQ